MSIRIAINGFGRIGKQAFKIAFEKKGMEVVAINDLGENVSLAHGLKYDSVYGRYDKEVSFDDGHIIVAGKKIPVLKESDPTQLPWKQHNVDVVLECTGRFTKQGAAKAHLDAGAKHVIVSAPTKGDEIKTFVLGVNDEELKGEDIISNASCTTNCIAPVMEIMAREFGILKAAMTTVHAYTADQRLVDGDHKDLRRARAAGLNIIPTTTGAASALGEVIPETAGIFDGLALRVPVPVGSLSDFTILVKRTTTKEEVNAVLTRESKTDRYKNIMSVTFDPIVSSDIVGSSFSSIVDLSLTNVIAGDLVKILSWYDNEWGYSTRLVEMTEVVMKK